uniref:Major capsid protein L1 n=2 Tax=unclassified Papillomaviridae TaxID=333774 RepID=A0A9N7AAY3_9PAPI|nr:L1 [Archaeolacerta bedriagae papillomavirus 1]DAZ91119.1 TPA_asm: L1 [Archaeolacerta bedriagae papillomavirus]
MAANTGVPVGGLYHKDNPGFWLPPPHPQTPQFGSTDEYVEALGMYAVGYSGRMVIVGHPYFEIRDTTTTSTIVVPKVNGNQYRVFRLRLPDPNTMPFCPEPKPDQYRYVWKLRCIQTGRGQPFNVGLAGNPQTNRGLDLESVPRPESAAAKGDGAVTDHRVPFATDPKQVQLLIVGCRPAQGEYWRQTRGCSGGNAGGTGTTKCPSIELATEDIEDGTMSDLGHGPLHPQLRNPYDLPLELDEQHPPVYPDVLGMQQDPSGNSCFFMVKREQLYTRHSFRRDGTQGEPISTGDTKSYAFTPSVSGSLVNSDVSLFGKPYYLNQAQGQNNGVLWGDVLFVTLLDNTRNNNLQISVKNSSTNGSTYDETKYTNFMRHVEEYDVHLGLELCRVSVTPPVLYHLQVTEPYVLARWGYTTTPGTPKPGTVPPSDVTYRYLNKQPGFVKTSAVGCGEGTSAQAPPSDDPPRDPFSGGHWWDVDMENKLKYDTYDTPFGRAFIGNMPSRRRAPSKTSKAPSKRKKK